MHDSPAACSRMRPDVPLAVLTVKRSVATPGTNGFIKEAAMTSGNTGK